MILTSNSSYDGQILIFIIAYALSLAIPWLILFHLDSCCSLQYLHKITCTMLNGTLSEWLCLILRKINTTEYRTLFCCSKKKKNPAVLINLFLWVTVVFSRVLGCGRCHLHQVLGLRIVLQLQLKMGLLEKKLARK